MTTDPTSSLEPSALHGLARPLMVLSGLALLVGTPFEVMTAFDDRPFAEVAAGGPHRTAAWLILLGFGALLLAVPALATHVGPAGRRFGRTVTLLAMLGAAGGMVSQWYIGTVLPWLAGSAHPDLTGEMGGLPLYGSMLLLVVGLLALGIGSVRTRLLPRPAAVMLIVAAVGGIFPFVLVPLAGAALLWGGTAGLRSPAPAAYDPAPAVPTAS
ncbi:hypothetical protein AB0L34_12300 [Micromonospora sp. NPDC052213]|uniref:hypothetical protein n=1 Tax=Micromonospora sp. NPDC052213 TaxID=3155812 RepID=UPI00343EDCC5